MIILMQSFAKHFIRQKEAKRFLIKKKIRILPDWAYFIFRIPLIGISEEKGKKEGKWPENFSLLIIVKKMVSEKAAGSV